MTSRPPTQPTTSQNKPRPTWSTPPQAAKDYGVCPETITGLIKKGELRAIDVSKNPGTGRPRYRIHVTDLLAFEASREVVGAKIPRRRKRQQTGITQYF